MERVRPIVRDTGMMHPRGKSAQKNLRDKGNGRIAKGRAGEDHFCYAPSQEWPLHQSAYAQQAIIQHVANKKMSLLRSCDLSWWCFYKYFAPTALAATPSHVVVC
jgi:hypothetical protein